MAGRSFGPQSRGSPGAAFALGKIGAEDSDPRNVVGSAHDSLRDKDPVVRDFAASALGDLLTAFPGGASDSGRRRDRPCKRP